MKSDLETLGYVMEFGKVDTQDYLLPQRRNRIYATADCSNGQDASEYNKRMQETMDTLSSDFHIAFEHIFDQTLPAAQLSTERQNDKLQEALEQACLKFNSQNIFVDVSSSKSRQAEYAHGVLTCVRPSHGIFSQKLGRWVTIEEMWKAQGLFRCNFDNPAAVDEMIAGPRDKAQDLAGNAFSSTCTQAKVLATLIHSEGWKSLSSSSAHETVGDSKPVLVHSGSSYALSTEESDAIVAHKASDTLDSDEHSDSLSHEDLDHASCDATARGQNTTPPEHSSHATECGGVKRNIADCNGQPDGQLHWTQLPVRKRARGKTKPVDVMGQAPSDQQLVPLEDHKAYIEVLRQKNAKRKCIKPEPDNSAPRKKRKYVPRVKVAREGKKSSISIWSKMMLIQVSWQLCIYI